MTPARRRSGTLHLMQSRRIQCPGRLAVIPVAVVSLAAVVLTGCGSNSSNNTPATNSPTAPATAVRTTSAPASAGDTAALCRDADALRASVSDLRNVPLNADALSTLASKADAISSKLDQLAADAKGSLRPQTDKLSAALAVLKNSLRDAVASPSTRNLSVIPSAITSVTTAAGDVRTALPDC
jgi:hypothetical protein